MKDNQIINNSYVLQFIIELRRLSSLKNMNVETRPPNFSDML